jgi:hypothetical protein
MSYDILLWRSKEPIIHSIFAACGEKDKPPAISSLKGKYCVEFFVDVEAIAFGYAFFV